MPWYTPAQWAKVRSLSDDPDSMGSSYEVWLKAQEEFANLAESPTVAVYKVYLDADKLLAYAKGNNRKINADIRVLCAIDTYGLSGGSATCISPFRRR